MELNKHFTAEELNITDYPIIEVGRKKAASEKFRSKADFDIDPARLTDAISRKGHVYAYLDKRKNVKAVYITAKSGEDFSCEERLLSPSIEDADLVEKMDEQVRFLLAERATYYSKGKSYFLGNALPVLKKKSEGINWGMAVVFAILYTTCFWNPFKGAAAVSFGICMGICMGLCFAKHTYYYEECSDKREV